MLSAFLHDILKVSLEFLDQNLALAAHQRAGNVFAIGPAELLKEHVRSVLENI
jgi:hypothetical protein